MAPGIPKPRHQRLVLQCYPDGQAADKKPNPSELSYLLFYVNHRRVKLEKVGPFLENKCYKDVSRGRQGNVMVALDIFAKLIEECHEDLNLFAQNVVNALLDVVNSGDLLLCQHSNKVFALFCQYHDGGLFLGDPEFVRSFKQLLEYYVNMAKMPSGPNSVQWKIVGLEAAKSIAGSAAIATQTGSTSISPIVHLLLSSLQESQSDLEQLDHSLDIGGGGYSDNLGGSKRNSMHQDAIEHFIHEESPEKQVRYLSFHALRTFFDTTSVVQIQSATRAIVTYIINSNVPEHWATSLVVIVAKWAPVQYRFVILVSLVEMLVAMSPNNVKSELVVSALIHALLSSTVNMVGLSVMDILGSLLNKQAAIIKHAQSNHEASGAFEELIDKLSACMISLGTHIYYADQISDMVGEVLWRCTDPATAGNTGHAVSVDDGTGLQIKRPTRRVFTNLSANNVEAHQSSDESVGAATGGTANGSAGGVGSFSHDSSPDVLIRRLAIVEGFFRLQNEEQDVTAHNSVPLSAWDGTQYLLNHDSAIVKEAYVFCFVAFLEYEFGNPDRFQISFGRRGYNQNVAYGFVSQLSMQINKLISNTRATNGDFLLGNSLLQNIVIRLQQDGVVATFPHLLKAHELGRALVTGQSSESNTLAQGIIIEDIFTLYLKQVGEVSDAADLTAQAGDEVALRKKLGLWPNYLDWPVSSSSRIQDADAQIDTSMVAKMKTLSRAEVEALFADSVTTMPRETRAELFSDYDDVITVHSRLQVPDENLVVGKARSLKQLNAGSILERQTMRDGWLGDDVKNNKFAEERKGFTPTVADLKGAMGGHAYVSKEPIAQKFDPQTFLNTWTVTDNLGGLAI